MGNKLHRVYDPIPREVRAIIICYNVYKIDSNGSIRNYWGYFKDDPTRTPYLLFIPKIWNSGFIYQFRGCFKPYHNIPVKLSDNPWSKSVLYVIAKMRKPNWKVKITMNRNLDFIGNNIKELASLNIRPTIVYRQMALDTFVCYNITWMMKHNLDFDLVLKVGYIEDFGAWRFDINRPEDLNMLRLIGTKLTRLKVRQYDAKLIEQLLSEAKRLKVCYIGGKLCI